MNLPSNETTDFILKIGGFIMAFLSFRWLVRIFAGHDKKLDVDELKKLTSFLFFLGSSIFIIVVEAYRPVGTEHIFSEVWIFFTMSGLLTVLSLDRIFEVLTKLVEAIAKLRTQIPIKDEKAPD